MSHYYEQELKRQQEIKELEQFFGKKAIKTPTKYRTSNLKTVLDDVLENVNIDNYTVARSLMKTASALIEEFETTISEEVEKEPVGLCPPGSYLCPEETIIPDSEIANGESKPLKETAGKPEGARYCFLTDIGSTIDHPYSHIGKHLAAIVREQDNNNPQASMYIIENLLPTLIDSSNLSELIGVRADALASGKYVTESYREKIDVNLLLDAAARHYLKLLFVENIDAESGYPHIAHITANLIIIHTQLRLHHE